MLLTLRAFMYVVVHILEQGRLVVAPSHDFLGERPSSDMATSNTFMELSYDVVDLHRSYAPEQWLEGRPLVEYSLLE